MKPGAFIGASLFLMIGIIRTRRSWFINTLQTVSPTPSTLPGTALIMASRFGGTDRRSESEEQLLEDDLLLPPVPW